MVKPANEEMWTDAVIMDIGRLVGIPFNVKEESQKVSKTNKGGH